MKEDKTKFINKLKNETEDNQKFACSCGYYSCDRVFTTTQAPMTDEKK